MKEDFFSKRKSKIEKIKTQIVHHIKNETEFLNPKEQENIKKLLKDMCEQFAYNENQIGDTVHFLLTNYEEVQY